MATDYSKFGDEVLSHFTGANAASAETHIDEYFGSATRFTGSRFELITDRHSPNRFTARDLVAVSMLGVFIPAEVSIWVLGDEGKAQVEALLRPIRDDLDVWEAPHLLDRDEHLWRLWDLLSKACWPKMKQGNGMGKTKVSKLLAAKRPRLVPITDSVVVKALPDVDSHWHAFRELLSDPDRRAIIENATKNAPAHLSLLRRIDVVLWMTHRHDSRGAK